MPTKSDANVLSAIGNEELVRRTRVGSIRNEIWKKVSLLPGPRPMAQPPHHRTPSDRWQKAKGKTQDKLREQNAASPVRQGPHHHRSRGDSAGYRNVERETYFRNSL